MFFNRHLIHLMGFQNWENKSNGDLFNDNEASRISEDDKKAMELGTFKFEEIIMDGKGIHRTFETRKFLIPRQGQEPLHGAGLRGFRNAGGLEDRALGRQRHLFARFAAGADLGQG